MRSRGFRRDRRGSALVEFAITVPILLAVLLGIFEFARAWNIQQVITNAAREGAREAVVPSATTAGVRTAVEDYLRAANVDPAGAVISIFNSTSPGASDSVIVSYNYQYQLFGKAVSLLSGGAVANSVNLRSTSIMRNE